MNNFILERLDKCFASDSWITNYTKATVTHLPRTHLDYCSLLIKLRNDIRPSNSKPFTFEFMWYSHPSFPILVQDSFFPSTTLIQATHQFNIYVIQWNKNTFGNISHKKNRRMDSIIGILKPPSPTTKTVFSSWIWKPNWLRIMNLSLRMKKTSGS